MTPPPPGAAPSDTGALPPSPPVFQLDANIPGRVREGRQPSRGQPPAPVLHLKGRTTHARQGATRNAFRYAVDYVLLDAEEPAPRAPRLFARNARGLASLSDCDHGGAPGQGRGAAWLREVLASHGLPQPARIRLLAQPRIWGHVFNPVAFWLCEDEAARLFLVVAEVTNTYGDRHSYLCHRDDLGPIGPEDELTARKVFHVSPFQDIAGTYRFRFDIRPSRIAIRIVHETPGGGIIATLGGPLTTLTGAGLLGAVARFGSARVLALIHWQALKLWAKGVAFRHRPLPPAEEVSR